MRTCRICNSDLGPGRGKHVVALDKRQSRRVCDDCVSMLTPPEELVNAPARADAPSVPPGARYPEPDASALTRSTVRATASTTVALAARSPGPSVTAAVWLAVAAATLAATAIAWLLLCSGLR